MPHKIKNIESLNEEINRLQAKARGLEEGLNENLDYLQENYSSLIMNSVFHGAGNMNMKNSVAGTVAGLILGNERIQAILSKLATHLLDKAADGLEKVADKFAKKED